MTLNTPHSATDQGGSQAGTHDTSGARYFVELGWSAAQAQGWLADSVALSQMPLGSAAVAAAEQSSAGWGGTAGLGVQVYRELEVLERQTRAHILREIIGRLARQAATGGGAGLALLVPSAPEARDLLVGMLQREGRRAKSDRLHRAIRALGAELTSGPDQGDDSTSVPEALCRTARLLMPGYEACIADAEIQLAFGDADAAHVAVSTVLEALPPVASSVDGEDDWEETEEEAGLRERSLRILALIAFERREPGTVLELLEGLPLALDRSASMGALRAAADYSVRKQNGAKISIEPMHRDEFTVPISPEERRRVARFLAFAHASPGSSARELRSNPRGDS